MKKNKKILISLLLALLAVSLVLMAACNNESSFKKTYAAAEQTWDETYAKRSVDTATIHLCLDDPIPDSIHDEIMSGNIEVTGTRTYVGKQFLFDYNLKVTDFWILQTAGNIAEINLQIYSDGENIDINLNGSLFTGDTFELATSVTNEMLYTYVPNFDVAKAIFYDTENISYVKKYNGGGEGFKINAADSLAYIFWQIAPWLSNNFNIDMLEKIEQWIIPGEVTGGIEFNKKQFVKSHTAQRILLNFTWDDLDYLMYNIDNFPPEVVKFIESNGAILNMIPNGLKGYAQINTTGTYETLPDDTDILSLKG